MTDDREEPTTLSHISTIDAIADDIVSKLVDLDRVRMKGMTKEEARTLHHGFGTYIRNTYGLWHDNALTQRWREDERSRDIVEGCDMSDDHPDCVSDKIIQRVWEKLQ